MELVIFAPNSSRFLAEPVSHYLGITLSPHEERDFEDGEHKIRPLISVRGKDVFVIQSLYSDETMSVNDKLCRLLFLIGALKDASAARVTAVVPYFAYARKDRRSQPRDPLTSRYMAQILEAVGMDRVVTMDVHNPSAYQNSFRCPADHLEALPLFVRAVLAVLPGPHKLIVVSPDAGGVKRAEAMRKAFERVLRQDVGIAFFEKARAKGELRTGRMIGDVSGTTAIIVDDLISTGRTLAHAARSCKETGAIKVYAATTHGVLVKEANQELSGNELDQIFITDTILPFRMEPELLSKKFTILPASQLFAEAIKRIHEDGSIVDLLTIS